MLEDGQLTDSTGRTVSFKNCLVVMTSNVGSSTIAGGGKSLGFALTGTSPDDDQYQRLHSLVTDELKVRWRLLPNWFPTVCTNLTARQGSCAALWSSLCIQLGNIQVFSHPALLQSGGSITYSALYV